MQCVRESFLQSTAESPNRYAPLKTKMRSGRRSEKYSDSLLNIRTDMVPEHMLNAVSMCFLFASNKKSKNFYLPIDKVGKRMYHRVIEFEQ